MPHAAAPVTIVSLLESVRQIEPIILAHREETEGERRLHGAVVETMREHGLYGLLRPRAFGGLEVDPISAFQVFEEVSRLDSAAGWNLQLSCGIDPFGAWFSDEGAKEIFGRDVIAGGSFFPPRRAVRVEGGYRVTGQTPFVSGANHVNWLIGLASVDDSASEPAGELRQPLILITACPSSDIVILDTWRTLGMRGTGSHDVLMESVFIPERRTAPLVPLEKPGNAYQGPLYRLTIWAAVSALSTVSLGIARAAIDGLLDLAAGKSPAYTSVRLRDRSPVQLAIGEAEAILGAARAYLYEALREAWDEALKDRTIDLRRKTKLQLAATHAAIAAAKVVDLVHSAVGTTGIRDEYQFQRYFRDAHTITQHGFISASRYESCGQSLLGIPIEWPFYEL